MQGMIRNHSSSQMRLPGVDVGIFKEIVGMWRMLCVGASDTSPLRLKR